MTDDKHKEAEVQTSRCVKQQSKTHSYTEQLTKRL